MLKNLTRDIALSIQAKSGASGAVAVWMAVVAIALLTAFVFLCVAGYDWLSLHYDPVVAGLIMTGIFVAIAVLAAIVSALIRRRVRERAILARAAKAHAPSWLLDPRLLSAAVQAGRSFGWQRIVPIALVGFMVAQWAREPRDRDQGEHHS
jgi:Na+/proline symporter